MTQLDRAGERSEHDLPLAGDRRGHEDQQPVDQVVLEEGGCQLRPALEQQRLHAFAAEAPQLVHQRPGEQLELGVFGQWAVAEGDPARLTRCVDVARVEPRIVSTNGAHAHGHRIGGGAELVHPTTAVVACHPAGVWHGHASVEGDGELERHERPPHHDPGTPGGGLRPRLEGVDVLDLDTG